MNAILMAFLGTLFTFGVTTLGACNIFFVRKSVSRNMQCIFLGFAAGVMVAASVWSLLIPGIERAELNGQSSCLVVTAGFLSGVAVLLAADHLLKKKYDAIRRGNEPVPIRKNAAMLVLAITIHNIPEGMAVGLGFAMAAQYPDQPGLMSGALALALGIGIQNYPEGTAVALPLVNEGMNKKRAFFLGSMSATVEPVFGVLAAALSGIASQMMPFLLAFAAGTMIYVVVQELIPEARTEDGNKSGTLGFMTGFLVMMILDVSLG